MKRLNDSELKVMRILWKLKKAFLKDIIKEHPNPIPAYTTISTLVNRMLQKDYIGFEKLGRDKQYYPKLEKSRYLKKHVQQTLKDFFDNSPTQFASYFTTQSDLSVEQLKELEEIIQTQLENKRNND